MFHLKKYASVIFLMKTSQIPVPTRTMPLTAGLRIDIQSLPSFLWDMECVKNPTFSFSFSHFYFTKNGFSSLTLPASLQAFINICANNTNWYNHATFIKTIFLMAIHSCQLPKIQILQVDVKGQVKPEHAAGCITVKNL